MQRQELSGGNRRRKAPLQPARREFLTGTADWNEHVTRSVCTALLGRVLSGEHYHGNRFTELGRGQLTLHDANPLREIPTALGRGQSALHTARMHSITFAISLETQRQRSAGPWPTGVDWKDIVDGDWNAGEWSVKN